MRLLHSKFTLIALSVVALATCVQLSREVLRRHTINTQIQKIESEIQTLQSKQFELKQIISYLQSDVYIEEEARRKLNLRKPGESVYVIPGIGTQASTTPSRVASLSAASGWWNYFFNKQQL